MEDRELLEVVVTSVDKLIVQVEQVSRAAARAEALGTVGTMLSTRLMTALVKKGVFSAEEVRAMADDALLSLEQRQNLPNMEQLPVQLARDLLEKFLSASAPKKE